MRILLSKNITAVFYMVFLLCSASNIHALTMESQQYQLQSEEVTTETLEQTTIDSSPVFALEGENLKKFNQSGFYVQPDNLKSISFKIDTTNLSLGRLTKDVVVTASNTIQLLSDSGSQISLSEVRPLNSLTGTILPNTTCDRGCSSLHASPWQNNTTYGLGFTLKGTFLPEDFKDQTYFRAIADLSKKEKPAFILKKTSSSRSTHLEMLFKVVSPDSGSYATVINLEALPSY